MLTVFYEPVTADSVVGLANLLPAFYNCCHSKSVSSALKRNEVDRSQQLPSWVS